MDSTTIVIVLLVIAAIAFFIFRRGRPAPHGTYDDPDVRSSGSIGGTRAYDDEKVRSSGSIGGGPRAYDSPDVKSEGSIGGRPSTARKVRSDANRESRLEDEELDEQDEPTYNDRKLKSGGSFGGSS